jgi:hypothetical protein
MSARFPHRYHIIPLFFPLTWGETSTISIESTFSVGEGGSIPANSTGNDITSGGNTTDITEGMWLCTALAGAKTQTTIGLIGTYGAGLLFTSIVMLVVRGKDPIYE